MTVNTMNSGESSPHIGTMTEEEIASQLIAERKRLEQAAGLAEARRYSTFDAPRSGPSPPRNASGSPSSSAGSRGSMKNLSKLSFMAAAIAAKACPIRALPPIILAGNSETPAQCNPTYFTVGNLIHYLRGLEAGGLSQAGNSGQLCLLHLPVPAGRAASECTSPSTGWRWRTQDLEGFGSCLFSQDQGIKAKIRRAWTEIHS